MEHRADATHVALIRGINVGGNNPVPMAALRSALVEAGVSDVRTYIQSGNVLLRAPGLSVEAVNSLVEGVLASQFAVTTPVVTVTADALRGVVADAPAGFVAGGDGFHRDVVFLRENLSVEDAFSVVQLRDGVDAAWQGERVIYFRRLSAERTKSKMGKIIGTPQYHGMTIRSWKTTTTIADLIAV
jgi:uncharacterized protein (DUF1697 family)